MKSFLMTILCLYITIANTAANSAEFHKTNSGKIAVCKDFKSIALFVESARAADFVTLSQLKESKLCESVTLFKFKILSHNKDVAEILPYLSNGVQLKETVWVASKFINFDTDKNTGSIFEQLNAEAPNGAKPKLSITPNDAKTREFLNKIKAKGVENVSRDNAQFEGD